MTFIQCECGKFQAELTDFPKNSPGRLACYCDDCQTYLHYLGRADLLDSAGGTEVIPVYPAEFNILKGKEVLQCLRLSPNGLNRWYTTCCKTPIGNSRPKFPWVGLIHRVYNVKDPSFLEKTFGPVRSRIQGRFAKGTPPKGTSQKLTFKDFLAVFPFLLKGAVLGKSKNSPLFHRDGVTPIVTPKILSLEERNQIRQKLGFAKV
jgi:hypothetical protein